MRSDLLDDPSHLAYVFPGQGAQMVGMGQDLFESSAAARAVFEEANEALGFSLTKLCFQGPEEELRQTINVQPAILTVSIACLKAAAEMVGMSQEFTPAFVAGHSLGEYTALVAAKAITFAQAVRLVRERGRLMQEAGERNPGTMAAILGLDEATVEEVCRQTGAQIANLNSAEQIVISGTRQEIAQAADLAQARGAKRTILLAVSGAFHSRLMDPAAEGMADAIAELTFRDPHPPIVANSTAVPLTKAEQIRDELLLQLCHCVQWKRSVEYMLGNDISTFVEIGPGQVLTGLIRRIGRDVKTLNLNGIGSILELST